MFLVFYFDFSFLYYFFDVTLRILTDAHPRYEQKSKMIFLYQRLIFELNGGKVMGISGEQ